MSPMTGPQPLKVLIATKDRAQLRRLSQFLDMMRYDVLQAVEPVAALAAIESERPALLLLGEDVALADDWRICRQVTQPATGCTPYVFLITPEPSNALLHEALESGVDDFLVEPVGYGELLTRLRCAARVLEFDRRDSQQRRIDPVTGLLNRPAFVAGLGQELRAARDKGKHLGCIVMEIDYFLRVAASKGEAAADELAQAVARELAALRTDSEVLGWLEPGRFGVLLPGADAAAAARWAERARESLAVASLDAGGTSWHLTGSFGVADDQAAGDAPQLLELSLAALQAARASGRNCVIRHGELAAEPEELTSPRKLFERTVAKDVMTPCTVLLRPDETVGQAVDLMHQTRLDAVVVVDADGKLFGLCEQSQLLPIHEADYGSRQVRDVAAHDAHTVEEDEPFATLMERFTHDPRPLVVVHKGHPVGLVTCNSLLVLPQPLTTESLAAEAQYRDTSDYLLVPDLRPVANQS